MPSQKTAVILKAVSLVVIIFGVPFGLSVFPAVAAPMTLLFDMAFWPMDGAQSLAMPETRFLLRITGGLMAAAGVLLWFVSARIYERDPGMARRMILTSLGVWFVFDCFGSIESGAAMNVVLNVAFLLAFVIPLWLGRSNEGA